MPSWSLFVDESGGFGPDEPSVVAGLLVERDAEFLARMPLRRELEEIWAPSLWPPHATDMRIPASRVVWHAGASAWEGDARWMTGGRYEATLRRACRELLDVLSASPHAPALSALATRRAGLDWGFAREVNRWLERNAGRTTAWRTLAHVADQQVAAMNDLVARVVRKVGPERLTLVFATSDGEPPGPPTTGAQVRQDAYVRALNVLAERVQRLLPDVDVTAWVLTRDVERGAFGKQPLDANAVREIFERARAATGGKARVRPTAHVVRYRDAGPDWGPILPPMHPMLVVADWIANHANAPLADRARGLPETETLLLERGVAPDRAVLRRSPGAAPQVGALPTIAAAGRPEEAVRASFGWEAPPPLRRGWPGDQAQEWIVAARRWR